MSLKLRGASLVKYLASIVALIIFCVALYVLQNELSSIHSKDILYQVKNLKSQDLLYSLLAMFGSYGCLSLVDYIAFKHIATKVRFVPILLSSIAGYGISHNIGFSAISGSAIRYRFLAKEKLDGSEFTLVLARLFGFFWLSTVLCLSMSLLQQSHTFSNLYGGEEVLYEFVALLGILIVFSTFFISAIKKQKIQIWSFSISIPSLNELVVAVILGSADWVLTSLTLYFLLPNIEISILHFFGVFIFSQLGGVISHVPGGLGVFESLMLVGLRSYGHSQELVASLVLFRIIYYFIPLSIALIILLLSEGRNVSEKIKPVFVNGSKLISFIGPTILFYWAIISGLILMTSGATPAEQYRLELLDNFIPLPFVEVSHLLGSVVGLCLILVSKGLYFRLKEAYLVTAGLLFFGMIFSLLKGFDYEEALALLVMLLILLSSKNRFFRKGRLFSRIISYNTIILALGVTIFTTWLMFFAYKHVEYENQLWWEFAFDSHASRSLRAAASSGLLLVGVILAYFFSKPKIQSKVLQNEEFQIIENITQNSNVSNAWLALLGDKEFILSESKKSFIMYAVSGSTLVVLGDPIGIVEEFHDLIWQIREQAEKMGLSLSFYEVGPDYLPLYIDLGLMLFKLGEEAIIDLYNFNLEGGKRSSLRHSLKKIENEGCSFKILSPAEVVAEIDTIEMISDDWLRSKKAREKGFSLGFFSRQYITKTPCAVICKDQSIVAFANIWTTKDKKELSVDLMRHTEESPKGVMDYLFVKIFLWGKENGYQYFNLGMTPLAGLEKHQLAPIWHKLGTLIFKQGENYYNFQGLRNYKEKFDPIWVSRYLASPGGIKLPAVLVNISTLISGSLKGVFLK